MQFLLVLHLFLQAVVSPDLVGRGAVMLGSTWEKQAYLHLLKSLYFFMVVIRAVPSLATFYHKYNLPKLHYY